MATWAVAEFKEGAQEAMRFQFNLLLLRTAGRIMLGMLKIALPFVAFQVIRNLISRIGRRGVAGAIHVQ